MAVSRSRFRRSRRYFRNVPDGFRNGPGCISFSVRGGRSPVAVALELVEVFEMFVKDVVFRVPGVLLLQGQVRPYERGEYDDHNRLVPGTKKQQIDEGTGLPIWSVPAVVLPADGQPETISIKVAAPAAPSFPAMTTLDSPQVHATPYVQRGRVAYSIRMTEAQFKKMLNTGAKSEAKPAAKSAPAPSAKQIKDSASALVDDLLKSGVKL